MKFLLHMKHDWMRRVAVMGMLAVIIIGSHMLAADAIPSSVANLPSPYTNAVPQSVFHEMDPCATRDPFSPIGFKHPPPAPVGGVAVEQQHVDPKLVVKSISINEGEAIAILEDKTMLEVGSLYKYTDPKTKATVEYKVLVIAESGIIVLCNDQEYEFPMKSSSLNQFIEKEELPVKEGTP